MATLQTLIRTRNLQQLVADGDVNDFPPLLKVVDDAENVYKSYELGRLHVEKVNTRVVPLRWRAGMVKPWTPQTDPLLRKWAGEAKIVCKENYDQSLLHFEKHAAHTFEFSLDIETCTPQESDEWLTEKGKTNAVDVLASTLTGLSITYGSNGQFTVYLIHDHAAEDGYTNLPLADVKQFVDIIPQEKMTWVHNAAFELPILYMSWGIDSGGAAPWHGFLPNVRDTRVAANYVDENRPTNLKDLSSRLLNYRQTTYEEVTRAKDEHGNVYQRKMDALKPTEVVDYGCDDTICTHALANHFSIQMEIEGSHRAFHLVETFPAYLTAKAFVQGTAFSLQEMLAQEAEDAKTYDEAMKIILAWSRKHLADPAPFDPTDSASLKTAWLEYTGEPLATRDRLIHKVIRQMEVQAGGDSLKLRFAGLVKQAAEDPTQEVLAQIKQTLQSRRDAQNIGALDLSSPKQMKHALYDVMEIPVRVINDLTEREESTNEPLKNAVIEFKKARARGERAVLTPAQWELVKSKASTNDTAIETALKIDGHLLDDETKAMLEAMLVAKTVVTRRSMFYEPYKNANHWMTGRVHASARQCGTVTRRYSMSDPNLQQLPKKGEGTKFRNNFKPHRKNAVVVSIDFSGQELRLAAERSQDKNMLACYVGADLKDPHSITAAGAMKQAWGVNKLAVLRAQFNQADDYALFRKLYKLPETDPLAKMADDLRKQAKNVNFTAQFGGSAGKISETLVMPWADADLLLTSRAAMFPGLAVAADRATEFAKKHGYALTMMGGRRHLAHHINSSAPGVANRAARQAWNMEIQGSAAEMTKLAMARLWLSPELHDLDVVFIAPVHDELVASVAIEDAVPYIRAQHKAMVAPYADMTVPVVASISLGPDFGRQIECGDDFDEAAIVEALNKVKKADKEQVA